MKTLEEINREPRVEVIKHADDGGHGYILLPDTGEATVVWSNGGGWEHVSVSPLKKLKIPTWNDMCFAKEKFFYDDEACVEYHPAKSEYVNNMPNCLHIWRPLNVEMPTPPSIMVGIKDGQTAEEVRKEIEAIR